MNPMVKRVVIGILIGAGWAVALLYAPPVVLFAALLFCSVLCQWEFYKLAEKGGSTTSRPIGLALGALWLVVVFSCPAASGSTRLETLLLAGGGILLLTHLLFDARAKRPLETAAITLLGFFYVPYLMSLGCCRI